jgi:hypothetical protein
VSGLSFKINGLKFKFKQKNAPNCQYYLQRDVAPDWMGSIGMPSENITPFFLRAEKLSEDIFD